ncbi:Flp pilus assembly protein CpaB [Thermopetrobacter sp. TC1]|uniref:Flp pilus assembly protein CpaB n=1 Tax=Thermopetrobacter sp. TC1 TaxID=1495045 RepID=UPI00068D8A9C|nr:Flp pilus assembly protein CpaB [Thermopetrobacter sp. TC1]
MQKKREIILYSVGAVAAIAAAVAVNSMFSAPEPEPKPVPQVRNEQVKVLVASKNVGIGDPLRVDDVRWQSWPKHSVLPGMIKYEGDINLEEVLKNVRTRSMIFAGEPIMPQKLIYPDDGGFLSSVLHKGMRGIAVKISVVTSAGGYIKPLDRVDIYLVRKVKGKAISELVMRNVKILAIDRENLTKKDDKVDASPSVNTATVEVTPLQAQFLAKISMMGRLTLALRSLAENDPGGMPELVGRFAAEARRTASTLDTGSGIAVIGGRQTRIIQY